MQAVMDESAARLQVSRLRLAMGASSAVCLFCAAALAAAIILYLRTGEWLFLALPVPFLAPILPAAAATFRLALRPAAAVVLEESGVRLGDDVLPYESIQWAELSGPAARPQLRFICVAKAHPPFRTLPFQAAACPVPGVYDRRHLDFVQEINLRVRAAGNPGIR